MSLHLSAESGIGWVWEPSVLLGLALLSGAYQLAAGPLQRRYAPGRRLPVSRQLLFHAGTLSVFLALVSPLDALADEYLFSAHMVQHMLLMFVAPPLWLLGAPDWLAALATRRETPRRMAQALARPLVAFLIFNGMMWVWHLPSLYDAALANESLHIFEHLSFMAAAVIGWWPVLGPLPQGAPRLSPATKSIYLFLSAFPCTALAALLALSSTRLYPFYGDFPRQWGLSPLMDQRLGGLIMWLPGDMILMLVNIGILYRWFNDSGPVRTA
jgi:cytochrome c oxidase assembly factor CtaG